MQRMEPLGTNPGNSAADVTKEHSRGLSWARIVLDDRGRRPASHRSARLRLLDGAPAQRFAAAEDWRGHHGYRGS